MRRVFGWLVLFASIEACSTPAQHLAVHGDRPDDWPQFGWDVASSSAYPGFTGINASNASTLQRKQAQLDGTVDASAIFLHGVMVQGAAHDVFFVTTSYGKTIAIDAASAAVLWEFTPPNFSSWDRTAQITNSTPAADPDRAHIYATAPDGAVRKLAVADGSVVWTTPVTLLPSREKMDSAIKVFGNRVLAVTGGYIGDAPPYQGHVAMLDAATGNLLQVWNSLCSNQSGLIQPSACSSTRSAIWGRGGAIVDAATGNIFVATGNGPYNGTTDWGDALIELDPTATHILANYTPSDNTQLENSDLDLGSTSPVILGGGAVAQGGKDDLIRVLTLSGISGVSPHSGGEAQTVNTPSHNMLFSSPAILRQSASTWLFAADSGATAAWSFANGKLTPMWSNTNGGTSPVVAGGLLYVYNPGGALYLYDAQHGTQIARLSAGSGHWNSPIVVDGLVALPEGSANSHSDSGVLDIWGLPAR